MNVRGLRDMACQRVDALAETLVGVSQEIHAQPELGFAEHRAARLLGRVAAAHGLSVEAGTCGLPTAFRADAGPSGGRRVIVCCEYDAPPDMGHACGHNVVAAAGLGAGLALAPMASRYGWSLTVLGTPAEEGGGGKVVLLQRGAFDGAAATLLVHPSTVDDVVPSIRAAARITVRYEGRAAHAALAPDRGRNALDALLLAFYGVSALRAALPPGDHLHGTIAEGGGPPNVVPAAACGRFLGRSNDTAGLGRLLVRAGACFRAGAQATGCRVSVALDGPVYRELNPSLALAGRFHEHLRRLGRDPRPLRAPDAGGAGGSSDLGNVSLRSPVIHPMLAIAPPDTPPHTPGFARCAVGPAADRAVIDGAKAMAMTAIDVWTGQRRAASARPNALARTNR